MDRQKLLLIFGGAWLSAARLTWLVYSITKAPKSDKTVSVLAAARDLPAGTRLRKGDLKTIKVGDKDIAKGALTDEKAALDRPLLFPISANEPINSARLASVGGAEGVAALIEPGKRAVSVSINDTSGAAGLILPRSHVDVLFTRPGNMAEAVTTTILQDATVLSIGRVTEVTATPPTSGAIGSGTTVAPQPAMSQTRAVTLLVTPEQAEKLELAKNQGKVSLSLRNPLDKDAMADAGATTTANLFSPNALRRSNLGRGNGRSLWSSLTGDEEQSKKKIEKIIKEPPPKPRNVVDVYRGEKHVQEIFQ
jgi:pilus assembly protein CpaB